MKRNRAERRKKEKEDRKRAEELVSASFVCTCARKKLTLALMFQRKKQEAIAEEARKRAAARVEARAKQI